MITFSLYTIHVRDLAESAAFYDRALGLAPAEAAPDGKALMLWDGVTQFRLTLIADPDARTGDKNGYLSFLADEAEALKARHAGMGCLCPDRDADGGWFIRDPDGYLVRILPAPKP